MKIGLTEARIQVSTSLFSFNCYYKNAIKNFLLQEFLLELQQQQNQFLVKSSVSHFNVSAEAARVSIFVQKKHHLSLQAAGLVKGPFEIQQEPALADVKALLRHCSYLGPPLGLWRHSCVKSHQIFTTHTAGLDCRLHNP